MLEKCLRIALAGLAIGMLNCKPTCYAEREYRTIGTFEELYTIESVIPKQYK